MNLKEAYSVVEKNFPKIFDGLPRLEKVEVCAYLIKNLNNRIGEYGDKLHEINGEIGRLLKEFCLAEANGDRFTMGAVWDSITLWSDQFDKIEELSEKCHVKASALILIAENLLEATEIPAGVKKIILKT